jgi:hypothetical protein
MDVTIYEMCPCMTAGADETLHHNKQEHYVSNYTKLEMVEAKLEGKVTSAVIVYACNNHLQNYLGAGWTIHEKPNHATRGAVEGLGRKSRNRAGWYRG